MAGAGSLSFSLDAGAQMGHVVKGHQRGRRRHGQGLTERPQCLGDPVDHVSMLSLILW